MFFCFSKDSLIKIDFNHPLKALCKPLLRLAESLSSFYEEDADEFKIYGIKYTETSNFVQESIVNYQNMQKLFYEQCTTYLKKLQSLKVGNRKKTPAFLHSLIPSFLNFFLP